MPDDKPSYKEKYYNLLREQARALEILGPMITEMTAILDDLNTVYKVLDLTTVEAEEQINYTLLLQKKEQDKGHNPENKGHKKKT